MQLKNLEKQPTYPKSSTQQEIKIRAQIKV